MSHDVREVHLLGYPVRLGARQQEHLDEVAREFMLVVLSRPQARQEVPGRLLELVQLLTDRFAEDLDGPRRLREQALADGRETVDLVYPALPEARETVTAWAQVMREVDDYCRQDELLSLATPPDVVALQEWVVAEFLAQLDGAPPTRWSGPR